MDLRLELAAHRFFRDDVEHSLTPRETEVLTYLQDRSGQTVGQRELEREVWGYRAGVRSKAVPVAMRRLRDKLEPDSKAPNQDRAVEVLEQHAVHSSDVVLRWVSECVVVALQWLDGMEAPLPDPPTQDVRSMVGSLAAFVELLDVARWVHARRFADAQAALEDARSVAFTGPRWVLTRLGLERELNDARGN